MLKITIGVKKRRLSEEFVYRVEKKDAEICDGWV